MPNGATYPIIDNEDLTATGLARRVAHFFVGGDTNTSIWTEDHLRDVERYEANVKVAEQELARARNMTEADAALLADAAYDTQVQQRASLLARQTGIRDNVNRLLSVFHDWQVPIILDPLRNEIILSLQSILDDYLFDDEFIEKCYTPKKQTPQEYIATSIEVEERSLEIAQEGLTEAQERREKTNAWLSAYHIAVQTLEA